MYQAFARKYRPQTWGSVVGQDHITTTLRNALAAGRIHHAYLFAGARGVGKTTVARIFAKAVNCPQRGSSPDPCNACPSCVDITEGRSLDIQEIDGASNTGVDDVREIRERVKYLPAAGRYKVYIIDEVHMLSNAAFNALLKTLEEPPSHVIFMFATTEPEKIPATILSRCQRYDFRRISVARIVAALEQIATTEGIAATSDALHAIAAEAEGSLRDAESLFDQAVAFAGNTLHIDALRQLFGFTDRSIVRELVERIVARNAQGVLAALETAFQTGVNLPRLAQEVLESMRHCWIIASCGELPGQNVLPGEEVEFLKALAGRAAVPEFHQWFTLAYRGVEEIARTRLPKFAMEAMLLQMVQVGPVQPLDELMEKIEEIMEGPVRGSRSEVRSSDTEHRAPNIEQKATVSIQPTSPPTWAVFLESLRNTKPQIASILEHGEAVEASTERVELRYPQGSIYGEMLKEADRLALVQQSIRTHFGARCQLVLSPLPVPPPDETRRQLREEKQQRQQAIHATATQHVLVKEALSIFGAEIKEIKRHEPT